VTGKTGFKGPSGAAPWCEETQILKPSCEKVVSRLRWRPILGLEETIAWTLDWCRTWAERKPIERCQVAGHTGLLD